MPFLPFAEGAFPKGAEGAGMFFSLVELITVKDVFYVDFGAWVINALVKCGAVGRGKVFGPA